MGRPVYQHELADPDFAWLVNTYLENSSDWILFESHLMPLVFIKEGSPGIKGERRMLPPVQTEETGADLETPSES